jgi:hypothetical protein
VKKKELVCHYYYKMRLCFVFKGKEEKSYYNMALSSDHVRFQRREKKGGKKRAGKKGRGKSRDLMSRACDFLLSFLSLSQLTNNMEHQNFKVFTTLLKEKYLLSLVLCH